MRIENMFLGYDLKVYLKQAKDETERAEIRVIILLHGWERIYPE